MSLLAVLRRRPTVKTLDDPLGQRRLHIGCDFGSGRDVTVVGVLTLSAGQRKVISGRLVCKPAAVVSQFDRLRNEFLHQPPPLPDKIWQTDPLDAAYVNADPAVDQIRLDYERYARECDRRAMNERMQREMYRSIGRSWTQG
jgi:hypothetical protein